jgi:hypothetical protein
MVAFVRRRQPTPIGWRWNATNATSFSNGSMKTALRYTRMYGSRMHSSSSSSSSGTISETEPTTFTSMDVSVADAINTTLPDSTNASSSNTNTYTTVKVLYCYSKYEVMDGVTFEDDVGQVDCALSIDDINKKAEEFFGETLNDDDVDNDVHCPDSLLEWYNASTQEWKPLTRMDETTTLLQFAQQGKMLPVRLPFMFDESDHPAMADDPTDPLGNSGSNAHAHGAYQMYSLDEAVQLLQQLRVEQGYETLPTTSSSSANDGTCHLQLSGPPLSSRSDTAASDCKDDSIAASVQANESVVSTITPVAVSTRDWVLQQATLFKSRGDSKLAHTLLMNIGALDRICSGLHDPSSETSSDNDDDDTHTLSFPPPPTWQEEQRHHDAYHHSHSHDRHGHCIIKEDDHD